MLPGPCKTMPCKIIIFLCVFRCRHLPSYDHFVYCCRTMVLEHVVQAARSIARFNCGPFISAGSVAGTLANARPWAYAMSDSNLSRHPWEHWSTISSHRYVGVTCSFRSNRCNGTNRSARVRHNNSSNDNNKPSLSVCKMQCSSYLLGVTSH